MSKIKRQLKVSPTDAELPKTRKQLFGRIVKEDFYLLVDLSLAETLFSVPLIVALIFEYLFIVGVEVAFSSVFPIVFYMGLIAAPCFGLKYVGRNACFSVMKKKVHNEGCFIAPQILSAVKSSGLKSFFNGFIVGISAFVAASGSVYLLYVAETFLKWTGIGVLILQFAVIFGTAEYFSASENFYELKFSAQWKNSFFLSLMGFLTTLLHFVFFIGIKFLAALFSPWLAIFCIFAYALVLNGISTAAATLYAHKVFDIHINKENYPEYVGKGLFKSDKETR